MWTKMKFKTIRWKLVETLEPPVVKHMVTRELLSKKDLFGQVTVRIHTKQVCLESISHKYL
jgi:large subunit ribosomal protein L45